MNEAAFFVFLRQKTIKFDKILNLNNRRARYFKYLIAGQCARYGSDGKESVHDRKLDHAHREDRPSVYIISTHSL